MDVVQSAYIYCVRVQLCLIILYHEIALKCASFIGTCYGQCQSKIKRVHSIKSFLAHRIIFNDALYTYFYCIHTRNSFRKEVIRALLYIITLSLIFTKIIYYGHDLCKTRNTSHIIKFKICNFMLI